jgi:hypothetical protein
MNKLILAALAAVTLMSSTGCVSMWEAQEREACAAGEQAACVQAERWAQVKAELAAHNAYKYAQPALTCYHYGTYTECW